MELVRLNLSRADEESIKQRITKKAGGVNEKTKFVFMMQAIVDDNFNVTGVFGDCVTGDTARKITDLVRDYYEGDTI